MIGDAADSVPGWPFAVNDSLNCHWSTAFLIIELEVPPITFVASAIDSRVSLE